MSALNWTGNNALEKGAEHSLINSAIPSPQLILFRSLRKPQLPASLNSLSQDYNFPPEIQRIEARAFKVTKKNISFEMHQRPTLAAFKNWRMAIN